MATTQVHPLDFPFVVYSTNPKPALPVGIRPLYLVALLFAVHSCLGYLQERFCMVV